MKILLPTDGSRYAVAAARAVAAWLARPGIDVDLLCVTPRGDRDPERRLAVKRDEIRSQKAAARQALQETAVPLESQGIRVHQHEESGDPREEVLRWAGRGYDLVAIGARGRGETPYFDVGSVALPVLERAPAPVLMVRAPRPGASETPDALHPLEIVFAVDAGRPARRATRALPELITTGHARVVALTVADEGAGGRLDEKEAGKVAERAARELGGHGLPTTTRVEVGPVAPAILEVAEDADLIVLGSRAVTEVERRELGSVALEVARSAPCSVLILRRGPSAPAREGEAATVEEAGIPFELSYRNVERSPAIEREVLRGVETLEWLAPDATRCDIMVEQRHPRQQTGNLYDVRINLLVPGEQIVVSRTPPEHRSAETVVTALVETFRTARRRLLEAQERIRGDVKHHEVTPHGVVSELFPDHGFIQGSDGRLVYFHRNSVLDDAWGHLEAGTEVRYVVEQGEQGPQASTVALVGKHHPVG